MMHGVYLYYKINYMKRRNLNNRSFANMCARTTIKSMISRMSHIGVSFTPTREDIVKILEKNRMWNKVAKLV